MKCWADLVSTFPCQSWLSNALESNVAMKTMGSLFESGSSQESFLMFYWGISAFQCQLLAQKGSKSTCLGAALKIALRPCNWMFHLHLLAAGLLAITGASWLTSEGGDEIFFRSADIDESVNQPTNAELRTCYRLLMAYNISPKYLSLYSGLILD